jgi:hypothetical protein
MFNFLFLAFASLQKKSSFLVRGKSLSRGCGSINEE